LAYQPPVPHEYGSTTSVRLLIVVFFTFLRCIGISIVTDFTSWIQGNQLVQMAGHGGHVDNALKSEMFPQQPSCFVSTGVSSSREPSGFNSSRQLEYGHNDMYLNPQISQSNQPFQQGNTAFTQRPLHPAPPHNTSSHFSYTKPTVQQHPQLPYHRPYSLPSPLDGQRRFVGDEQWRMPSSEFKNKSSAWWVDERRENSKRRENSLMFGTYLWTGRYTLFFR
jgi:hypothetical protein